MTQKVYKKPATTKHASMDLVQGSCGLYYTTLYYTSLYYTYYYYY